MELDDDDDRMEEESDNEKPGDAPVVKLNESAIVVKSQVLVPVVPVPVAPVVSVAAPSKGGVKVNAPVKAIALDVKDDDSPKNE